MKKLPPLLTYTVLRLLAFLVPFGLFMLLPIFREYWWLALLFATLIGLSLSLIFLREPLSATSRQMYEKREARRKAEADDRAIEDAATE